MAAVRFRIVVKIVATSILMPALLGAWAVAAIPLLGWMKTYDELILKAHENPLIVYIVFLMLMCFAAVMAVLFIMFPFAALSTRTYYCWGFVPLWVAGIGVAQYGLGLVVLFTGLDRRWMWVSAAIWTALVLLWTAQMCVRDAIDPRRAEARFGLGVDLGTTEG
jgi:hypothetical protein